MDLDKIKREKADQERRPTSVSLPLHIKKRLDVAAASAGVGRSRIVERLIQDHLGVSKRYTEEYLQGVVERLVQASQAQALKVTAPLERHEEIDAAYQKAKGELENVLFRDVNT